MDIVAINKFNCHTDALTSDIVELSLASPQENDYATKIYVQQ